jgi:hypothetical protein
MISKLQRVVCHLNDRLSAVEQMSGITPPAIVPAATGMSCLLMLHFVHMKRLFDPAYNHGSMMCPSDYFVSSAQKG